MASSDIAHIFNFSSPSPNTKERIPFLPIYALVKITGLEIVEMQTFNTELEMQDFLASYNCVDEFTSNTDQSDKDIESKEKTNPQNSGNENSHNQNIPKEENKIQSFMETSQSFSA